MKMTRRNLIKAAGAAAFVGSHAASLEAEAQTELKGPFRFGVIADPQFAPVPNTYGIRTRYYSNSVWKLSEAIAQLNQEKLEFVITLGDLIDRYWDSFHYVLPLYDDLRHDAFFLLGNHDFNVPDEYLPSVPHAARMSSTYYDFTRRGYRFIVLDGNEVSLFAPRKSDPKRALAEKRFADLKAGGAAQAQEYNGSLSDTQFAWLQQRIHEATSADQKIIVFNHYPVFPAHETNLWDCERVAKLVAHSPNVVAYLNGHNHAGNYGQLNGKHFVTFRGMVETATENAYSIVEVLPDRLEITGFGIQESRTLRFT